MLDVIQKEQKWCPVPQKWDAQGSTVRRVWRHDSAREGRVHASVSRCCGRRAE
jgi:hypothetical protein